MIYVSHLLPDQAMRQIVEDTGMGIESIEFAVAENLDCLEQKIREYRARMEYMGTGHLTLHGPFLDLNPMCYDSEIRKATLYRYAQAYEAGLALGARKIIFHSCFLPTVYYLTDWAKRMAEFWNGFLKNRSGIQILMENVYDQEITPLIEVKQLVESPDFKLCFDMGHAHCYSPYSVEQWIREYGSSTGHVHIHDNCGDRDSHLGLGEGTIQICENVDLLKELSPDAGYTIECSTAERVMRSYRALCSYTGKQEQ